MAVSGVCGGNSMESAGPYQRAHSDIDHPLPGWRWAGVRGTPGPLSGCDGSSQAGCCRAADNPAGTGAGGGALEEIHWTCTVSNQLSASDPGAGVGGVGVVGSVGLWRSDTGPTPSQTNFEQFEQREVVAEREIEMKRESGQRDELLRV